MNTLLSPRKPRSPRPGDKHSHAVGTGVGASSGAITGALAGTAVAGPAGTLLGAVIGAVGGALAGRDVAESMNPTPGGTTDDHPMAAAVGAGTGTFAGAVLGTVVAGPVGAAVGAALGAGAGSVAGEGVGEMVDARVDDAGPEPEDRLRGDDTLPPTPADIAPISSAGYGLAHRVVPADEDAYWSEAYREQAHYAHGRRYVDYAPAYRMGYSRYSPGSLRDDDWMPDESEWTRAKGESELTWPEAQAAMRAAWQRVAFRDFPAP